MVVGVLVVLVGLMLGVMVSWFREEPAPDPEPQPVAEPESLEGALATQLAAGAITRAQYVRAMEWLALREEERHPMAPLEDGLG
ncbi:hypothetical protein Ade02nite_59680 [Paractinoplanes deccanensis]|uniref:SHOCT domain-containing protein n=2 Tax=Paractinoplanes deccanensis TaxID=113561 RepID=A0ABQ3YBC1_9ACTN|nr:hypothetical protein Ade02nite_59680 [Actinoplanes deccanensis]